MVEMDVRGDDVVNRNSRHAGSLERREQARHRIVGAGVDERRAVAFDDEVARVEHRPMKAGVDYVDTVREALHEGEGGVRHHGRILGICPR